MYVAAIALVATISAALTTSLQARRPIVLDAADCSRINMMFGEHVVARAVQFATVPVTEGVLDIQPEANGGVQIERGHGPSYAITACIGAGAATAAEAQEAADAVRLSVDRGRVRVENGGRARTWNVHLIVEAPDNARIRVETSNGPIGINGVSGQITARASNGPIGLDDVSGTVTARAQNGPIGVTGSRGDFDVQADNGPISVALSGRRWEGRLDARAHNGPLKVDVPDGYQSGIEITSSGASPWNCRIAACTAGNRDWEHTRILRIGGDPVVVRISTSNGPVTVQRR